MKAVIVATLLSLFLSSPAMASVTDSAQQMRSSSKAASGYIYVNRLDAPADNPFTAAQRPADRLSGQR
ncbi:hypothetical protein [Pantoea sp. M_9]|uniref:hypothetical protein n=1 Tax=Pantoea sp. M_9 TaxID=2608041 RepID=UPI001232EDC5|nr:hypothetical protein [Pantoea sp. M_9]KAA5968956.1 hypothetical protein F3I15_12180 [Pantoea sp. M_9]